MILRVFLLLLLFTVPGCKSDPANEGSILIDELQKTIENLKSRVSTTELDSLANQEVEKLFTFEYTVKELPIESTGTEINETLSELGLERWECFHVEEKTTFIRLYCKRRPKTYLRYVPRMF